jgi:hypothetical protein
LAIDEGNGFIDDGLIDDGLIDDGLIDDGLIEICVKTTEARPSTDTLALCDIREMVPSERIYKERRLASE